MLRVDESLFQGLHLQFGKLGLLALGARDAHGVLQHLLETSYTFDSERHIKHGRLGIDCLDDGYLVHCLKWV